MMARGNWRRSSKRRASRASASGSRPGISGTEVVLVAMPARGRGTGSGGDEPQLAQPRRGHDLQGVLVGEAGVAEAVVLVRRMRLAHGRVQAVEGQVAE